MGLQPINSNFGSGGIKQARTVLSNTMIKALPTTWPTLIPAIADCIIIPLTLISVSNWNVDNQYGNTGTLPDNYIYPGYNEDYQICAGIQTPLTLLGGDSFEPLGKAGTWPLLSLPIPDPTYFNGGWLSSLINVVNAPVKLICYNTGGDFTGGNDANTLVFTSLYLAFNYSLGLFLPE